MMVYSFRSSYTRLLSTKIFRQSHFDFKFFNDETVRNTVYTVYICMYVIIYINYRLFTCHYDNTTCIKTNSN